MAEYREELIKAAEIVAALRRQARQDDDQRMVGTLRTVEDEIANALSTVRMLNAYR